MSVYPSFVRSSVTKKISPNQHKILIRSPPWDHTPTPGIIPRERRHFLVKRKLIERFTIVVNDEELGYNVKALTGINMDTKKRDHIIEELFKIDGVREVAEVTGRFDILVTMYSKSLDQMHKMVSERIGRIEGIQSSESFIEMKSRMKAMPYMPSKDSD